MSTEAGCSAPSTCPCCRGELEPVLHRDFKMRTHGGLTAVFDVTLLTCRTCGEVYPLAADDKFMARAAKEWFAGYAVKEFNALVDAIREAHKIKDLDVAHLLDVTRHHVSRVRSGKVPPSLQLLRFARFVAGDPAHARDVLKELGIPSEYRERCVVAALPTMKWSGVGASAAPARRWAATPARRAQRKTSAPVVATPRMTPSASNDLDEVG